MVNPPTIGNTEQDQIERGYPFIVRREPKPIPTPAIDAEPAGCALINLEWLAHVAGALEALNQPDAWTGTDEEIYQAQQQIEALQFAFSSICELAGGATVQYRQTDCTLEVSEDNGQTWTVIFDAGCAEPVIIFTGDSITINGETVITNEQINNVTIIDDTSDIAPNGSDKRCAIATMMTDIIIPTQIQEAKDIKQNSASSAELWSGVLAIAAIGLTALATGGISLIGTTAAYAVGLGAAGATVGSGAAQLVSAIDSLDLAALDSDTTPAFYQAVKCVIYCVLPDDGILTPTVARTIAGMIKRDLVTTYPTAAPLVAEMFLSYDTAALNEYTLYGAMWTGENCAVCEPCPAEKTILMLTSDALENQTYVAPIVGTWDATYKKIHMVEQWQGQPRTNYAKWRVWFTDEFICNGIVFHVDDDANGAINQPITGMIYSPKYGQLPISGLSYPGGQPAGVCGFIWEFQAGDWVEIDCTYPLHKSWYQDREGSQIDWTVFHFLGAGVGLPFHGTNYGACP